MTNTTPIGAVPRRRPARGDAGDRARDRPLRRRARARPAEVRRRNFIAADAFPLTTASGATYDSRRLRAARSTSRSRRPATTALRERAAAPARAGGTHAARHRRQRVRRDHERPRRDRVRRRRDHAGRRGDPAHRLVLARAGPRDDVRDDRRATGSGSRSSRCASIKGDTDAGRAGHRHVRLEVDRRSAAPRRAHRGRGGRRAGAAARRRPPRGQRRRHRARPRARRASTCVGAPAQASPGRSWPRGCGSDGRLERARTSSTTSSRRSRRSRSARTSPSSRSTPRPAGRAPPPRRRRRRGHADQPASSRGPGARRRRARASRRRSTRRSSTTRTATR